MRTLWLCVCATVPAVPAVAQCPDGTPPPCRAARAASATNSLAVLYFEDLSPDSTNAYLAAGLTEELTDRLGAIQRLRVSSKGVVRRAQREAAGDAVAIGRALNVRHVVEGSVRRSAERVRVSVHLVRTSDGVRVGGDTYDRTMTDLLALQDDIAEEVVRAVVGQLLPGERTVLHAQPTRDAAAYNEYLRGRYLVTRRTPAALQQAVAAFESAVQRDPRFAGAEAGRAYAYAIARGYGADWMPAESLRSRAMRAAERALELDSGASDTWIAQGIVRMWFTPRLRGASEAYARARALDPRNAEAHHAHGVVLSWLGEDSAAITAFRRALDLDPARAVTLLDLAEVLIVGRRFAEALTLLDSAVAVDPAQARPYARRANVRLYANDVAGARGDAETALRLSPPGVRDFALGTLVAADWAAGDTTRARSRLGAMSPTAWGGAERARAFVAIGEPDSAVAALETNAPTPGRWSLLRFPEFDRLRADPRFQRVFDTTRP